MKYCLTICFALCFLSFWVSAQDSYTLEIQAFQDHLNDEFANPDESPLKSEDLEQFEELAFFPINPKLQIKATFVRTENQKPFRMKTTTTRRPIYEKFGEAHFELDGKNYVLNIYQSHQLREREEFKTHLFLPFTDLTNGDSSYGGGRFIDLEIPSDQEIIIDFNKAYNPYCAYNSRYSCPIPPKENDLPLEIKAGVMKFHD
ncbi:DUF1684 domain-containing protein [Echinicola sp. 20G]|uniref:DUF1684 domain-containing protein n=1 Tax=Echinicola sp. 20G TaxID=2781961 RepID=UPI0019111D09|nr:DUF1684 domain-containing protein [Echinicola sp. 20G]